MLQTCIDEAKKVREQEHIFVKDEKRAQVSHCFNSTRLVFNFWPAVL